MTAAALLAAAYLVGSIPSGYWLVRACTGRDVRAYGSHNIGAINVTRVGGPWLGLATLGADMGKAGAVVIAGAALGVPAWAIAGAAFLVMLGHAFSFWLLLRERRISEGKSVASALGVLLALAGIGVLAWPWALLPLGVWTGGLLLPRLVTGHWCCISPATMTAAASIPVAMWAAHPALPYLWLGLAMAGLILARHKGNIQRLRAGAEPRLGRRLHASASR
jgi:glycerol-3-phosphate acyltransferase PlsY